MEAAGKRYIVHPSRSDVIKLFVVGESHIGNIGHDEKSFDEDIAEIASDDHNLWIGLGDYLDCISVKDKRYDPRTVDPKVKAVERGDLGDVLSDMFIKKVEPIKDKCLGLIQGNH